MLLGSCGSLKQNILFKTETAIRAEAFQASSSDVEQTYLIEPFDRVAVTVMTNKGERLIDPNREFEVGESVGLQGANAGNNQMMNQDNPNSFILLPVTTNNTPPSSFLIDGQGLANLPMIGEVQLGGLSLKKATQLLESKYASFYEAPFVTIQYLNKRVILMGALGDKVVPLRNERMTLLEVLAIAGGFQEKAKPNNIRLIRGDLKEPAVQLINLSTVEGMKNASLHVQPNDIIYIEPRRRIDRETIGDLNSLITPFTTILTLVLTIVIIVDQTK